jgi:hypothetical protein
MHTIEEPCTRAVGLYSLPRRRCPWRCCRRVTSRRPVPGSPPQLPQLSCPLSPSPVVDRRPNYCDWPELVHAIHLCPIRQISVFYRITFPEPGRSLRFLITPPTPRSSLAADRRDRNQDRGSRYPHPPTHRRHSAARARSASDQRPCKCKWALRMTASSSSPGTTT